MTHPTRSASPSLLAASAALALAACAGAPAAEKVAGPGSAAAGPAATAGDIAFDLGPTEIKGTVFAPQVLGRPGMPLVEGKKKLTLDKQRALVKATKDPVQREAQAAVLATMLYQASKVEADKNKEKALVAEARQALADAADNSKDKVDELTLRLLATYDLYFEDYPAAEKHWQALVERTAKDPKEKDTPLFRAWWGLSLLMQDKNAEAKAAVGGEALAEAQPELAYVAAWARWRTGDAAGAWQAIQVAARAAKELGNKDVLDRELALFAARAGVAVADAAPVLARQAGDKKLDQYGALYNLSQALAFAGRSADAAAALDRALATAGGDAPGGDVPQLRVTQARYLAPLDTPDASLAFARQAMAALPGCTGKCDPQQVITGVRNIGLLFHALYATANDHKYYEAAKELYALSVDKIADAAVKADAQKYVTQLETTLKNKKVGTGTHDKGVIASLLGQRNQEVQACLEGALVGNRRIAGALAVTLEVEAGGGVTGVTTDPKGGLADVALVATCVAERAKAWRLPKRDSAGTTRIKLAYTLAPAR